MCQHTCSTWATTHALHVSDPCTTLAGRNPCATWVAKFLMLSSTKYDLYPDFPGLHALVPQWYKRKHPREIRIRKIIFCGERYEEVKNAPWRHVRFNMSKNKTNQPWKSECSGNLRRCADGNWSWIYNPNRTMKVFFLINKLLKCSNAEVE